jgi:1,4-dihydroxy-2-naphthoate octaprenyltransferase
MYFTGLPTLYLGLAGCALTLLYPLLKYHALGDLDIFLTYSLLPVMGTSYVVTGEFVDKALWIVLPIGLITVGILHINNSRDMEHDKRAGIHTFAMLVGKRASSVIYCLEVILPFVWVIGCVIYGSMSVWSLLVLIALKPAIDNARKAILLPKGGMEVVTGVDEATAKSQLMFSLLLVVSLFIASFI